MTEFLSPKELASRLNVHLDTVYRWVMLPGFPIMPRPRRKGAIRIDWQKFSDWKPSV